MPAGAGGRNVCGDDPRRSVLPASAALEHDPREHLDEHPDTPERIVAVEDALRGRDWLGFEVRAATAADEDAVLRTHSERHVESLRALAARGGGRIDDDTYLGEASWRAALHAAGGACDLVRALIGGESPIGFAGLRPAGHHAERDRAMGFCLLNNVAIAADVAIAELGVPRVLILDWDVHHGNGTAEIFRRRDDVLFVSIHQSGTYPGTGALSDSGSGAGAGYTINLPVHAGSDGELWLSLLEYVILPAAREFAPELAPISAGFDAHRLDPVGGCRLETLGLRADGMSGARSRGRSRGSRRRVTRGRLQPRRARRVRRGYDGRAGRRGRGRIDRARPDFYPARRRSRRTSLDARAVILRKYHIASDAASR